MQIRQLEQEQKSWIIEGYPRTEMQAVALQKMGVIPDKIVLLEQDEAISQESLLNKFESGAAGVRVDDPDRLSDIANNAIVEYQL